MGRIRCGTDVVKISRINNAVLKNDRFCTRVFTQKELEYFRSYNEKNEILAGFFAAKEAFAKYLGTGFRGFGFSDIEVDHDDFGAPFILFKGQQIDAGVSISHDGDTAVAMVCGNGLFSADTESSAYRGKMKKLIPVRSDDANKGDCGRVLIIAGSRGMTGAAALCGYGALRSGCGLVTVGIAESEQPVLACKLTEAMTLALPCTDGILDCEATGKILSFAEKVDAVAIGPGLGRGEGVRSAVMALVTESSKTLIIDADGINELSGNIDILKEKRCDIILTPHPGEMSRLTGISVEEIQSDREKVASDFAKKYGVCLVLKGKDTVIADKDGTVSVNPTGNSGMATGGTGDVLCGVITAFAAQGLNAYGAAVLGVYIHGLAGDFAMEDKGIHGLIASDVAECLAESIKATLKDGFREDK